MAKKASSTQRQPPSGGLLVQQQQVLLAAKKNIKNSVNIIHYTIHQQARRWQAVCAVQNDELH